MKKEEYCFVGTQDSQRLVDENPEATLICASWRDAKGVRHKVHIMTPLGIRRCLAAGVTDEESDGSAPLQLRGRIAEVAQLSHRSLDGANAIWHSHARQIFFHRNNEEDLFMKILTDAENRKHRVNVSVW